MKLFLLLLLTVLAVTTFALVEEDESGVLILTDENFDDAMEVNSLVLVEVSNTMIEVKTTIHFFYFKFCKHNLLHKFYAPWCRRCCKCLAPEFAKAAIAIKGESAKLDLKNLGDTIYGIFYRVFGLKNSKKRKKSGKKCPHFRPAELINFEKV